MLGNCGVISIIVSVDAKLDHDEISVIVCRRKRMKYVDLWIQYPDITLASNRFVFGLSLENRFF